MPTLLRDAPLVLLAVLLAAATTAPGQAASPPASTPGEDFSAAQLEQLVAPIALHPDALLMQELMAATYPLELVQAARWLDGNDGLTGDALDAALKSQDWDASVKSLCTFPDVLKRMADNLDWAQDLGEAFLGQQTETLDAVQRMRGQALAAGNLATTKEQTVTQAADGTIVIAPAKPTVVYVPTYYPTVVYGSWAYPYWYYPTMYVPPPPGYRAAVFTAGVIVGAALWGDCHWGWGRHEVHVDIDHYHSFNRHTSIDVDARMAKIERNGGRWDHDPAHRRGVNYRHASVAQRHGGPATTQHVSREQARGHAGGRSASERQPGSTASDARSADARPAAADARRADGGGALSGSGHAGFDRAASRRGAASRGAAGLGARGGRR